MSGTDGVGTKLKVAFATGVHDTIGIDLVAMCVNDIITTGARPLFFLDYFATGKLDVDVAEAVDQGHRRRLQAGRVRPPRRRDRGAPRHVRAGEYDLAGFAVGVVERAKILDGKRTRAGDAVIGVASSGLHSNGYSLARRRPRGDDGPRHEAPARALGMTPCEAMLVPTRIYAKAVAALARALGDDVHAMAHITGGGLRGNLPRVLPDGLGAALDLARSQRPAIFELIAAKGPVEEAEMRATFNVGVGLVVVVAKARAKAAIEALTAAGERAFELGKILEIGDVAFEQRVRFA